MAAAPISGVKSIGQDGPLTFWQIAVVSLCVLVNVCDGIDTTSIAYAAPSLLREWNIAPQTFGIVLSAGAFGLMLGALVVAPPGHKNGRPPITKTAPSVSRRSRPRPSACSAWPRARTCHNF
jgi:MFS family permease